MRRKPKRHPEGSSKGGQFAPDRRGMQEPTAGVQQGEPADGAAVEVDAASYLESFDTFRQNHDPARMVEAKGAWRRRVRELEAEGICTSDAQAIADADVLLHKERAAEASKQARDDLRLEGFTDADFAADPGVVQRRVAQQELIANVPGIVNLDPPGAQANEYDLDGEGRPTRVYYASFGSNLFADRFAAYIAGGQPEGATRTYDGCRDTTPPSGDIPVALNGTVHYAGESKVWEGGGVAFLDTSTQGKSLGRAYCVTADQFDDVVAQECDEAPGSRKLDLPRLLQDGSHTEPGTYGKLVHVGDYRGAPVFTFTGPFTTAQARAGQHAINPDGYFVRRDSPTTGKQEGKKDPWPVHSNPPSVAYQNKIAAGLAETHGLTEQQARTYFAGSTGYHA